MNERRGIINNIIILLIFSLIAVPYGILSLIDGNIIYVVGGSVAVIAVSLWWISYIVNTSHFRKFKKEAESDISRWKIKKLCLSPNEYSVSTFGGTKTFEYKQFKLRLSDTKEDFVGRDIGKNEWIKYFGNEIEITYLEKSKLIVLIEKKGCLGCSDFEVNFSDIKKKESPYKSPTPVMLASRILLCLCAVSLLFISLYIVIDKVNRYNTVDSNRNATKEYVEKCYGDDFYVEDYEILNNWLNPFDGSTKDTFMVYSGNKLPPFKVTADNGYVNKSEYFAVYDGKVLNDFFIEEFFPDNINKEQYISRCIADGHIEGIYKQSKDDELIKNDTRKISYLLVIFVDEKPKTDDYKWIYSLNEYIYSKYNDTPQSDFSVFFMDSKVKDTVQNEFDKNTMPDLSTDEYRQYTYLTLDGDLRF